MLLQTLMYVTMTVDLQLYSDAAAEEERQDVSSINTIDELSDAITGGKDIGLWSSNIPEKLREYWLKN